MKINFISKEKTEFANKQRDKDNEENNYWPKISFNSPNRMTF